MRTVPPALPVFLVLVTLACGGGDATGPSPTPTSVSVVLSSTELVAGDTARATASLRLSDGTSSAITTGWLSDNTTVASVTTDGTITALNNGSATIYVVSQGHQGQQVVRVYPVYGGQWTGSQTLLRCVEATGGWAGLCPTDPLGTRYGVGLGLVQSLGTVLATPSIYIGDDFAQVPVQIQADGRLEFTAFWTAPSGSTVRSSWNVVSVAEDRMSGTILEEWRHPLADGLRQQEWEVFLGRISGPPPQIRSRSLPPVLPLLPTRLP
ncbi:MAG: Ig-like domain-containing protein [Vicinamibacterales bacterium]